MRENIALGLLQSELNTLNLKFIWDVTVKLICLIDTLWP